MMHKGWWIGFFAVTFFFFSIVLPPPLLALVDGEIKIQTGYNTLEGQVGQSSLEEGFFYTIDLSLTLSGILGERWDYSSSLDLRKSTDLLLEREDDLKLRRFILLVKKDRDEYRLGNLYTDLGQYFFNQRYRGVDVTQGIGPVQVKGLLGERHPAEEGNRYARYTYGLRIDLPLYEHGPTLLSAVTSSTLDDPSSVEFSPEDPVINNVYGLLFSTQYQDLSLSGTLSASINQEGSETLTGENLLLQSNYQLGRLLLSAGIEHVSPGFVSLGGAVVSDRQTIHARLRARIIEPLDLDLRYTQYHDNLDGELGETTTQRAPRLQFSIVPPTYETMRITGWAMVLNKASSLETVKNDELTLGMRWLLRSGLLTLETGVEQLFYWDHIHPEENLESRSYIASLRGRYHIEDQILQPRLLFTLREEHTEERSTLTPLYQMELGLVEGDFSARLSFTQRYRDINEIWEGGRCSLLLSFGYQFWEGMHVDLTFSKNQQYFKDPLDDYEENRFMLLYGYSF